MERNGIPDERLRLYARAAADEGRIETQQRAAHQALQDVSRLLEAGEVRLASGAVVVALRAILLRAAAPAGSEGVAADRDLAAKTGAAAALDELGVPVAAVMVRAAVAHEAALLTERDASPGRGDRP